MTLHTAIPALALLLCVACGGDDADEPIAPTEPPRSGWAARADSTRALDNPPGVDFRLYVRSASANAGAAGLTVSVDWFNDGPGAVVGDYRLLSRLAGPVTRAVPLDDIDLDGLRDGNARTTTLMRSIPPDIVPGSYTLSLQLTKTDAPVGSVDIALQRDRFDAEGFWVVGQVQVP